MEYETVLQLSDMNIPIKVIVEEDNKFSAKIGDDIFPLTFKSPFYISGEVSWTFPNNISGNWKIENYSNMIIDRLPQAIADSILFSARPPAVPSSRNFSAGSKSANKIVADAVKQAVVTVRSFSLTSEMAGTCAYVLVRNIIDRHETDFPDINDTIVCENIWRRIGWEMTLGVNWSQTTEYAEAARVLISHGVAATPL